MAASKASRHAKALSTLGASKGGLARKEALSPEERRAIAKRAAQERWAAAKGLPRETHSGILKLGEGIPCSVLDNDMRVLSVNGLVRAFGSTSKGRQQIDDGAYSVPPIIAAANIRPFISDDLLSQLESPVSYRAMTGGRTALGYDAKILRKICDTLLDARAAGALRQHQLHVAQAAEMLIRAFADVGITALIDEATGYQYDRARIELQRLLEAYVVEDMRPWVSLFPDSFFRQVYRIHGWQYKPGVTQGPRYVGKFINKYVYGRLPPEVLEKLKKLNPVVGKRRKHKHFQFLSEEIGEPTVDRHLASVTTLMSVSSDKRHFVDMFRVAFPMPGEQLVMGPVVLPSTLPPHEEDDDADEHIGDSQSVDGVEMTDVVGSVRERILSALRSGNTIGSGDLAMIVYGDRKEGTFNKLRARMKQLKEEGLVESPSKGIWKKTSVA